MTTFQMWTLMVAVAGCGNVVAKHGGPDAQPGDDTELCEDPTSVDSCGEACVACTVGSDREVPTCDGNACASICRDDAPRCSDDSCSQLGFDFDDGTLQGAAVRAPSDLALSARTFRGESVLAIDVTNLTEVSFTVPVCVGGSVDFRARTLHALVFFDDGGTTTGDQYFVQTTMPDPESSGSFLQQVGVAGSAWVPLQVAMGTSSLAGATTTVTFQVGTFGAPFSGSIYFDNITFE